jgi:uracil-DNA glycosylase
MPKNYIDIMDSGWYARLKPCLESPYFHNLLQFIQVERQKYTIYPDTPEEAFRAFNLTPYNDVKVVILGQDPYHDGSATGLAFANSSSSGSISPSLRIIMRSVAKDYPEGYFVPKTAYGLEHWAQQGVLLLNTALTVRKGEPGSHSKAWAEFTNCVLKQLNDYNKGIIYVLWGKHALKFLEHIRITENHVLKADHPMYSGYSGKPWNGETHFKDINDILLKTNGKYALIDWL